MDEKDPKPKEVHNIYHALESVDMFFRRYDEWLDEEQPLTPPEETTTQPSDESPKAEEPKNG